MTRTYHWFHIKTGTTGKRAFEEETTLARAAILLNQWNKQTVTLWDTMEQHYIYWME